MCVVQELDHHERSTRASFGLQPRDSNEETDEEARWYRIKMKKEYTKEEAGQLSHEELQSRNAQEMAELMRNKVAKRIRAVAVDYCVSLLCNVWVLGALS